MLILLAHVTVVAVAVTTSCRVQFDVMSARAIGTKRNFASARMRTDERNTRIITILRPMCSAQAARSADVQSSAHRSPDDLCRQLKAVHALAIIAYARGTSPPAPGAALLGPNGRRCRPGSVDQDLRS